jgi:ubiquinone/menaquinone biosynthesis C-methylase UbiE
MTNKNPMSTPEPWTLVAEGYVTDTQPMFRQYCEKALELSGFNGAGKVLDVACGPGTLSLLIRDRAAEIDAVDFSPGMLACFNREIAGRGIANITTHLMDGQALDFGDDTFDFGFSIFGLMFFPDRLKGFRELHRTLKPGGRAAVTSWAPVEQSPLMQLMFGAIQTAFPKKPQSDSTKILNLEDPEQFRNEMEAAGFADVTITPFDGSWPIDDVEAALDSMVRGGAPLAMLKSSMPNAAWQEKRAIMLAHLRGRLTQLPVTLSSQALIGTGSKKESSAARH